MIYNGYALIKETPLLLKDLPAGEHFFEVRKEGYGAKSFKLQLAAGEIKTLTVDLTADYFQPAFPEEQNLVLKGRPEQSAGQIFLLPEGTYTVRRREGQLQIEPLYRHQGVITGLNIALPLSLAFSGVLTLYDILNPPNWFLPFSPATVSAYGISLGLAGLDLVLHLKRSAFRKSFGYTVKPIQEAFHVAREYYERGENMLSLSRMEEALRFYSVVVQEHKDSPYLPQALFKTAKIHFLTGDDSLAVLEFQLIVNRYPLPELYDKAQKALADLYFRRGSFKESIDHLQAMVFVDPLYGREEIDQYSGEILEQWLQQDLSVLEQVIGAYQELAQRYPDSENLPLYRYKLAEFLHRAGRGEEAMEQLSLIQDTGTDPAFGERVQALRKTIQEGL